MVQTSVIVVLLILQIHVIYGKNFTKCEFVHELQRRGASNIREWTCIARQASNFNTQLFTDNGNLKGYGIFQIYNNYWCENNKPGKYCAIDCESFLNDDILDDVVCAEVVKNQQSFDAWNFWKEFCENKLPDISEC